MVMLAGLAFAVSFLLPTTDQSDPVGAEAPDFNLERLGGKEISLKALRGHVVVLHFWATYWESCYVDMGHLDRLYREFEDQGVVVLGINVGQLPRVVEQFISKRGYTYPQLVNARGELILKFQATDEPTVIIIGKDGTIVSYAQEQQGEQKLRSTLKAAMQ